MANAVIVATARTPIGRAFKGSFATERPEELAAAVIRAALEKVPELDTSHIDELIVGCGVPGGVQGSNIARIVAIRLGWDSVPAHTVSRFCASSVQAIRSAAHAIEAGDGSVYISAGVESISSFQLTDVDGLPGAHSPFFDDAVAETVSRSQSAGRWVDPRLGFRVPDPYIPMGQTAENLADLDGISRRDQDEFALRSQLLTAGSRERGFWNEEITPYRRADGVVIAADDSPRPDTTREALSGLKPAFRIDGSVTAGNSCPLNDGAAALVIMSEERAIQLGITPLARILATSISAVSPEIMGRGPVSSIKRVLARARLSVADVDQFEINEAFAVQVLSNIRELGIDQSAVNVNGGSIALGHPYGMTGARIATTLIHSLQAHNQEIGVEAMCVAGGQGMALVLQRLS